MSAETWKPVVGYEGLYDVSDLGRVRSWHLRGANNGALASQPRVMRPNPVKGYPTVSLKRAGRAAARGVHVLVAQAFIGPRPDGMEVCHGDGKPANSALSNLRYGTPKENQADRKLHGTDLSGERTPAAKLTEEQVLYCRRVYISRHRQFGGAALAARFGVTQPAMSLLLNGRNWKGVGEC